MTDVLVIGGGIIGLLTAREIAESGARVTLVEMGHTGRESSWAGGGIVSPLYPWRYADSVSTLARWSQLAYPDLTRSLYAETGIDPEYIVNGMLMLDMPATELSIAQDWAARHDATIETIAGASLHEREPELEPTQDPALLLADVAQIRTPRLTKAVRRSLDGRIELREREEVLELLIDGDRAIGVRTPRGDIHAHKIVICAGAWTAKLLEQLGTAPKIHPVRGQMLLFFGKPDQIKHITLHRDNYAIPRRDGRVLFGSTLEHSGFSKGTTAEAKEALYRDAIELFPALRRTPIENHWAGLRPGSPSGIPYIGAYPGVEGLYFNAGHYRNGLVTAPASARLLANLLFDQDPILPPEPYALDAARP